EEGKDPSEISRKDEIFSSSSGLISIAGGKLTGYRKMAERVVNLAVKELKKENKITYSKYKTLNVCLSGGKVGGSLGFKNFIYNKIQTGASVELPLSEAERHVTRYGSNIALLYRIIHTDVVEAVYYSITKEIFSMVVYGIEEEM